MGCKETYQTLCKNLKEVEADQTTYTTSTECDFEAE